MFCTHITVSDSRVGGVADVFKTGASAQGIIDKLEEWDSRNLKEFSEDKCQAFQLELQGLTPAVVHTEHLTGSVSVLMKRISLWWRMGWSFLLYWTVPVEGAGTTAAEVVTNFCPTLVGHHLKCCRKGVDKLQSSTRGSGAGVPNVWIYSTWRERGWGGTQKWLLISMRRLLIRCSQAKELKYNVINIGASD